MNVLDLFSGIGGFSLGLERAGMRTVAFCEIEPFCRRVLRQHWPDVPIFGDIRELTGAQVLADTGCAPRFGRSDIRAGNGEPNGPRFEDGQKTNSAAQCGSIDVICGGFPCQDISVAGKGAGIDGSRSGLWSEYARIIGELRPRFVIVENVAALLGRGLERVLGDLAALGFDAEWHCIPASAVGAPHRRDRLWIVAYPVSGQLRDEPGRRNGAGWSGAAVAGYNGAQGTLADAARDVRPEQEAGGAKRERTGAGSQSMAHASQQYVNGAGHAGPRWWPELTNSDWWRTEPDVGRVAHGVPARVDRLRSLGNAVVPQIPEIIGRAIMMTISPQHRAIEP